MATIKNILLLGDSRLYETCPPVEKSELPQVSGWVDDMAATVIAFRKQYGAGRAIAAPQLGIMRRLIVMNIDQPVAFINPVLSDFSEEQFEMWDDCMSFPNLLVKLTRHKRCKITYLDLNWEEQSLWLEDDLSELLQHEYDHLNGILATMRAIDEHSFKWKA